MKTLEGLTEADASELMFAEVGDGWININLLANLTSKQLKTAHIDDEHDFSESEGRVVLGGYRIDVWLNKGEFVTLAGGFKDEKIAEMVLYFIKPKTTAEDYKDLKQDGLTVFEFRPDLT